MRIARRLDLAVLFALSILGAAEAQADYSAPAIIGILRGEHGPEWPTDAASDRDKLDRFEALRAIFDSPGANGLGPYDLRVVRNALREMGRFSRSNADELFPEAKSFFGEAFERATREGAPNDLKIDLMESLANSRSPEGAEWIIGLLSPGSRANVYGLDRLKDTFRFAGGLRSADWNRVRGAALERARELVASGMEDDPDLFRSFIVAMTERNPRSPPTFHVENARVPSAYRSGSRPAPDRSIAFEVPKSEPSAFSRIAIAFATLMSLVIVVRWVGRTSKVR